MTPDYYPSCIQDFYNKAMFSTLLSEVPWESATEARNECFMAQNAVEYTYGAGRGVRTYKSVPFHYIVEGIQDVLNENLDTKFNVCFLNRYDNAQQQLGWHADDSPGMDLDHPIAVVSFGQAREIWWRENGFKGVIPPENRQLLENGSLFIMPAGFQRLYQHRIPKGDRFMLPRVSLTYRRYAP